MDKAKTLEVLRGMKFMQRKEEAKRRALYEVQNKAEVERRLREHTAQASSGAQPQSATIIYDTSFPAEMYSLARRHFVAGSDDKADAALPPAVAEDGGEGGTRQEQSDEHRAAAEAATSAAAQDDTAHSIASDEASDEDSVAEADPSAPPPSSSSERFYVQAGIRAPKLPKRLRETMTGKAADAPHRQKRRNENKSTSSVRMEQAQQTRTAAATAALKQAGRTLSMTEDSFEAMRSAALSMFKQRTKDLTRVAEMQSQVEQQQQALNQLQATSAELQSVQASLEAHVEQQESRVHSREAQLKEVHNVLVQLSEEQRLFQRVQQSTEKVTGLVSRYVSQTVGAGSVLTQLLARARDVLAGRSATDFRHVAADLRHRGTVVQEAVHELQRASRTPEQLLTQQSTMSLLRQLQEWSQGAWEKHAELAAVREVMTQIAQAASATLGSPRDAGGAPETPQSGISPDSLFALAIGADEEGLHSALRRVDALLAESARQQEAWRGEHSAVQQRLEAVGLCCEVLDVAALGELHEQWAAFRESYHAWQRQWAECEAAAKECACVTAELENAEAAVQAEEAALAESTRVAAAAGEEAMARLEDELRSCEAGMAHAQRTWAAQHRALCEMRADTAQLQAEADELRGRCNEAEAEMTRRTEEHNAACAALEQEDAAAAAEVRAAQATQAALQSEIAAHEAAMAKMQAQMQQLCQPTAQLSSSLSDDESCAERETWLRELLHSLGAEDDDDDGKDATEAAAEEGHDRKTEDDRAARCASRAMWAVLMGGSRAEPSEEGGGAGWLAEAGVQELQAVLRELTAPSAAADEDTTADGADDTASPPPRRLARGFRRALALVPANESDALVQALKAAEAQLQHDYTEHQTEMESMHKETAMLQAVLSDAA